MTGEEHYEKALELLRVAQSILEGEDVPAGPVTTISGGSERALNHGHLAARLAQVHATLAAATKDR